MMRREAKLDAGQRERALADLATRQHGVVSLLQLKELGFSGHTAWKRADKYRLHRVHRGVYAVGHAALTREGRWLAAVLAHGSDAALSHRSAAALLGLMPWSGNIEVTIPPHDGGVRPGRARPGIQLHRPESFDPEDVTQCQEIPCTTVARTLADLAGVVSPRDLERAFEQAEILRLFDLYAVMGVLERSPHRRGANALRRVLGGFNPTVEQTRSEMERRFLALCRDAHLSAPAVNTSVETADGSFEVDFIWPDARLIAEADGFRTHGTQRAFERDRYRDQCLTASGWRVVRVTWRQLIDDPQRISSTIRALLATPRTASPPPVELLAHTASNSTGAPQ